MKRITLISTLMILLFASLIFGDVTTSAPSCQNQTTLRWCTADTPKEIQPALRALAEEYPLVENVGGNLTLEFKPITAEKRTVRVYRDKDRVMIEYSDLTAAIRGVGAVLSGITSEKETSDFNTLGLMLDCSRNGVITVDAFKGWLRRLALMGYNMAMLYTEDTYELPGEPCFGKDRGAYRLDELRQIDAYAATLGIEMIPCIQTLGHMEHVLKWPAYKDITDTKTVLLVDEEKTYTLIEKMIAFWSQAFKSRRIHIGMDETFDLGEGRYKELHGENRAYDLFNRHLARVIKICRNHNYAPMIWSDMYFRMASPKNNRYDVTCKIPEDVVKDIPPEVQLVYWDYVSGNEDFYATQFQRHREIGHEPIMAGGVWTWAALWHNQERTEKAAGPSIRGSRKAGVKEILFTSWGDNGAYCDFDSAMAGYAWVAEQIYCGDLAQNDLKKRYAGICHSDYDEATIAGDNQIWESPNLLWDDPVSATYWQKQQTGRPNYWPDTLKHYTEILARLQQARTATTTGGDLNHARNFMQLLVKKAEFRLKLENAYAKKDKAGLKAMLKDIPEIQRNIDRLTGSFKTQWLRRFKPAGLDVIEERLAKQKTGYDELARQIGEFLEGKTDRIGEMKPSEATSAPTASPAS